MICPEFSQNLKDFGQVPVLGATLVNPGLFKLD